MLNHTIMLFIQISKCPYCFLFFQERKILFRLFSIDKRFSFLSLSPSIVKEKIEYHNVQIQVKLTSNSNRCPTITYLTFIRATITIIDNDKANLCIFFSFTFSVVFFVLVENANLGTNMCWLWYIHR